MTFVESVCKFNEIAGTPNEFNERKAALYIGLIMEELAETVDALPEREAFSVMKNFLNQWSLRFKQGDFDENMTDMNRVAALDGFVDLAVVSLGGAYSIGADVPGATMEVANSNLSKYVSDVPGEYVVLRDENGKVRKGPFYRAPELKQYLK